MLAIIDKHPSFKTIVDNWKSYCTLADSKERRVYDKFSQKRHKVLYEEVDRSLPLILEDEVWFIRILAHKIKQKLVVDIRKFEKLEDQLSISYHPTQDGITIPLTSMIKVIDPLFKLIKKWKGK